jgi:hypothetical protein
MWYLLTSCLIVQLIQQLSLQKTQDEPDGPKQVAEGAIQMEYSSDLLVV